MLAASNARGEGVQRLPRQGRRQGADRQRRPRRAAALRPTRPAAGPSGRRASAWAGRRARPEATWSSSATRRPASWASTTIHVMQLALGEQSQEQVLRLFDELDALTREPFRAAKAEIDAVLARHCGISVDELRPWHYHDPFFQESPAVFGEPEDALYAADRHPQAVPRVLRGHRAAGRRRARAQRPLREAGQEPARLLHRHRPPGRRPRAGQHRAGQAVAGHDAARAGPLALFEQEHPGRPSLRAADRGPHADHRGRGHDVRASRRATPPG